MLPYQTKGLWIVWIICGLKLMNSKTIMKLTNIREIDLDKTMYQDVAKLLETGE